MATLTIRNLPDYIRDLLRLRAAQNGRSMEAEARAALEQAVTNVAPSQGEDFGAIVRDVQDAFASLRSVEVSVVDELIAERRLEAWRESLEDNGHREQSRSDFPNSGRG